jgi:hypothetical protein
MFNLIEPAVPGSRTLFSVGAPLAAPTDPPAAAPPPNDTHAVLRGAADRLRQAADTSGEKTARLEAFTQEIAPVLAKGEQIRTAVLAFAEQHGAALRDLHRTLMSPDFRQLNLSGAPPFYELECDLREATNLLVNIPEQLARARRTADGYTGDEQTLRFTLAEVRSLIRQAEGTPQRLALLLTRINERAARVQQLEAFVPRAPLVSLPDPPPAQAHADMDFDVFKA